MSTCSCGSGMPYWKERLQIVPVKYDTADKNNTTTIYDSKSKVETDVKKLGKLPIGKAVPRCPKCSISNVLGKAPIGKFRSELAG